jgi:hypothetical protein
MTVSYQGTAAPTVTTTANAQPKPFRYAMLVPTILVDVVAPIGILKTLERFGVAPVWALAGGCFPPALNNLRVWITSRRLDPVGLLMIASIASGTVASIVAGNLFYRVFTDVLLNSAWALVFLGSLLVSRPLIFFIVRPIVTGEDASRNEIWNGLWRYKLFQSALRMITATWGICFIALVLVELGLACVLAPETVVTYSPLMGVSATLALIVFTRQRMRSMRERLEREEQFKWPL